MAIVSLLLTRSLNGLVDYSNTIQGYHQKNSGVINMILIKSEILKFLLLDFF